MPRSQNFLLGNGEILTTPVKISRFGQPKNPPYTLQEAKTRFFQGVNQAQTYFDLLPKEACPNGKIVASVTLHPRYISKSDYPKDLFSYIGAQAIGSKTTNVTPQKWGIKNHPQATLTEQIFISAPKSDWGTITNKINITNASIIDNQIMSIENIDAFKASNKLKSMPVDKNDLFLEIVLHNQEKNVIELFEAYSKSLNSIPLMHKLIKVNGLTFIPLYIDSKNIENLAEFSFVRAVRCMPSLRPLPSNILRNNLASKVHFENLTPLDNTINVAIFDGGVEESNVISECMEHIEPKGISNIDHTFSKHGLGVTSALLFGNLDSKIAPRPFCKVDHIRVLDNDRLHSDTQCIDVLNRIIQVLDNKEKKYDFINISLGPSIPTDDDDITAWTAALDARLATQDALVTVAAGNDGDLDEDAQLNRIQPPADGVNIVSVGACTSLGTDWERTPYSCVGPGRNPGLVKPDGVAFGGWNDTPFNVLENKSGKIMSTMGTSFAAPLVLRTAVGIKAYLGEAVSPKIIRALLIHTAENKRGLDRKYIGWGRFLNKVEDVITCEDNEVTVIYQGNIPAKSNIRAYVPVPDTGLIGNVTIKATLVITPEVDPEHPACYTRGGLEIKFRPNINNYTYTNGKRSNHPRTVPFFSKNKLVGIPEFEFRQDGIKWEPCLSNSQTFRAASLDSPSFDIYCHTREGLNGTTKIKDMPYALIITVKAPKIKNLYNEVVRTYNQSLIQLRPKIQIPISTRIG